MSVAPTTDRRLRLLLARAQREGRLPSVVGGLLRDGEVVWRAALGAHAGPGAADPLLAQYRIGSITKTFTAVLVHQLVRDDLLSLDAPVGSVLKDAPYADRTVRSLLAHSSGMQSEPVGDWWERSAGRTWEELVAANDDGGAVFTPWERFHYSNLGYALLGRVVEQVTGLSWWEAVAGRLLEPLGMGRTTYLPAPPAATGYSVHPYAHTLVEEPATDTLGMAPAGQPWSTLDDLLRYAGFLLAGHPDVLSLDRLLAATHPQSGDRADALAAAHGLGFMLAAGGSGMLVGHSGSVPGFLAGCFVDHDRRTGAVVLSNATTGAGMQELAGGLLDTLEECEPTLPAAWSPEQVPAEYADLLGVWYWGNTPLAFSCEEGSLVVREDGVREYAFSIREGRIVGTAGYHSGEQLRVFRTAEGAVGRLEVATFVLTRAPYAL